MASTHLPTKPIAIVGEEDQPLFVEETLESSNVPAYEYEPLLRPNSFRFLKLKPGKTNSPLECEIITHDLDSPTVPPYRAVSYTWKSSRYDRLVISMRRITPDDELHTKYSIRHPIWCGQRRLLISTNLRDALKRIRSSSLPINLWIDAICINQNDLQERALQVLLMKTIYYNAEVVLLWIGEEAEDSGTALDLLSRLAEKGENGRFYEKDFPSASNIEDTSTCEKLGIPDISSLDWKSVANLLSRPVFRRIWIIQEIVTAREVLVYCGSSVANLADILGGVLFLNFTGLEHKIDRRYGSKEHDSHYLVQLCEYQRNWVMHMPEMRWSLIWGTRRCEASDPRDKIFAIIGLFRNFARNINLPEDYDLETVIDIPSRNFLEDSDLATLIDIPSRSIDDAAIRTLRTSTNLEILELRDLISDFLLPFVYLVADILEGRKISEEEVQAYYDTLHDGTRSISEHISGPVALTREWKEVAIFSTKLVYTLIHLSYWWPTFVFEMDADGEDGRFSIFLNFLCKCCGCLLDDTILAEEKWIDIFPAEDIRIYDHPVLQLFSRSLQRPLPWSIAGLTMPDYSKTVEEVYLEFTLSCFKGDRNLDMLSAVEDRSIRTYQNMLSWVPDYSVDMPYKPLRQFEDRVAYTASSTTTYDIRWSPDEPHLLGVDGYQIDHISKIASMESASRFLKNQDIEWRSFMETANSAYIAREDTDDAFWQTLVGGCVDEDMCNNYRKDFHAFLTVGEVLEKKPRSMHDIADIIEGKGINPKEFTEYIERRDVFLGRLHHSRRLFWTQKGYLGIAPMSAKIGDIIYVFAGGRTPYVVREILGRTQCFNFVGDCYVHGIMRGEALEFESFSWTGVSLL